MRGVNEARRRGARQRLGLILSASVFVVASWAMTDGHAQTNIPGATVAPLPGETETAAPVEPSPTPAAQGVAIEGGRAGGPKIVRPPGSPTPLPGEGSGPQAQTPSPAAPAAPTIRSMPAMTASRGQLDIKVGQGNMLTFTQPVETVLVANPNVLDVEMVSARSAYIYGVSTGTTNLFALTSADQVLTAATVRVSQDEAAARREAARVAATTGGQIGYIQDRPVTTGMASDLGGAMKLDALAQQLQVSPGRTGGGEGGAAEGAMNLNTISASQQVGIRVRFAEVSRTAIKNLGINWRALFNIGNFNFGIVSGAFPPGVVPGFVTLPGTGSFGYHSSEASVDAVLDALQQEGLVNILAEPTLTAVSGKTANFLAGGEFPIPVPQGNETISIEYKQFGVSLAFTPTVLPGDRIGVRVQPEVSQLSEAGALQESGFSIPALTVRRADTTIELASGQTFAMAGLFQRNISNSADQIPLLGDLPILGKLFQSSQYQRNETELVILITPYLMKPEATPNAMALPAQATAPTIQRARTSLTGGNAGFMLR